MMVPVAFSPGRVTDTTVTRASKSPSTSRRTRGAVLGAFGYGVNLCGVPGRWTGGLPSPVMAIVQSLAGSTGSPHVRRSRPSADSFGGGAAGPAARTRASATRTIPLLPLQRLRQLQVLEQPLHRVVPPVAGEHADV